MKIQASDHKPRFGSPVGPWHWWYSLRLVRTWDGRHVWLMPILRRLVQKHMHLDGGPDQWYEYHFPWGYYNAEIGGSRNEDSPNRFVETQEGEIS